MPRRRSWSGFSYERTSPIPVKDGIKARSRKGSIGETWWSRRWNAVVESLESGARLGRGRSYARKGQVMNIDIRPGKVSADVQGSRPKPYRVTIKMSVIPDRQWEQILDVLASRAIFVARLLNGEMPTDIEEAFDEARVPLFPGRRADLETACSCPDWANPCKHIAAVYYLLAEEFDRDPFLIFRLRGMDREALVEALRERRAGEAEPADGPRAANGEQGDEEPPPLEECLESFWEGADGFDAFRVTVAGPVVEHATLKRLGQPPFRVGRTNVLSSLGDVYDAVTDEAFRLAYGQEDVE